MPGLRASNVVLHVGMDKTGSTSIRATLHRHLKDPSFHYVSVWIENSSRSIAAAFKDDPGTFPYFRNSGLSNDELSQLKGLALRDIADELGKAAGKTAIISAEVVSGFNMAEFQRLSDFIKQYADSFTVAAYIRKPKAYMESNLQQQIKANFAKRIAPNRLLSNYRSRFEKFDSVLGSDNVKLWLFEPSAFPESCVVQDFCRRLGIRINKRKVIRGNEGLSQSALSLLFAYRKFGRERMPGPSLVQENAKLIQCLRHLSGPKMRLHSSIVRPVIMAHQGDISWMEDRLGESLAEDLTKHDEHSIRTEKDLLKFAPEALQWLAMQLGPAYVKRWHPKLTPQEVANWMEALQVQLISGHRVLRPGNIEAPLDERASVSP